MAWELLSLGLMRASSTVVLAAIVCIGMASILAPRADARRAGGPPGWEQQADQSLGWGRGMGRQLMTEEEWQAHHHEMQTLRGEAREKEQREWHERMQQRAKERGITLPTTPGPHRGCPGAMGGACPPGCPAAGCPGAACPRGCPPSKE